MSELKNSKVRKTKKNVVGAMPVVDVPPTVDVMKDVPAVDELVVKTKERTKKGTSKKNKNSQVVETVSENTATCVDTVTTGPTETVSARVVTNTVTDVVANNVVANNVVADMDDTDDTDDTDNEHYNANKRYFRCVYVNNGVVVEGGCYCGKKPKQAGNKACTKLCNSKLGANDNTVLYGMYDVRKKHNANVKTYIYVGKRIKLTEPAVVPIHLTCLDADTGNKRAVLDEAGRKIPKLHPTTNVPMVIKYNHYNVVNKVDLKKQDHQQYTVDYNTLLNWTPKVVKTKKNDDLKLTKKLKNAKQVDEPTTEAMTTTTVKKLKKTKRVVEQVDVTTTTATDTAVKQVVEPVDVTTAAVATATDTGTVVKKPKKAKKDVKVSTVQSVELLTLPTVVAQVDAQVVPPAEPAKKLKRTKKNTEPSDPVVTCATTVPTTDAITDATNVELTKDLSKNSKKTAKTLVNTSTNDEQVLVVPTKKLKKVTKQL